MKRLKIMASTLLMLSAISFTSCTDYFERPPFDSLEDSEYWQTEEHCRTYSYGFYPTFFNGYGTLCRQAILLCTRRLHTTGFPTL